jgi:hypothetical protein
LDFLNDALRRSHALNENGLAFHAWTLLVDYG